jgi:hypothetical protein
MCVCWSLCHMGPSINYAQVVLIKSVKNETLSTEDLQNVNCNKKRQHVSINVWPQGVHVMSGWQHQAHPLKWGGKWGSAFTYRADGRDRCRPRPIGRSQSNRTALGRPPRPSAVGVADGRGGEEVQNFQEKALHLLQHLLPLVARLSKSVIEFQG